MRKTAREMHRIAPNGLPSDILPILRYICYKQENGARAAYKKLEEVSDKMFARAKGTWAPGESPRAHLKK